MSLFEIIVLIIFSPIILISAFISVTIIIGLLYSLGILIINTAESVQVFLNKLIEKLDKE